MTMKAIQAQSGHTLYVEEIEFDELPHLVRQSEYAEGFQKFYVVKNWDKDGVVFFYLAKLGRMSKTEICAFYKNGKFWSGYGKTFEDAINGAQRDGWMYAE
jgi:hypothetical protein